MSSYQIIKIFIVNKKYVNQVIIFDLNVACIGSSNHIFLQCYNWRASEASETFSGLYN